MSVVGESLGLVFSFVSDNAATLRCRQDVSQRGEYSRA